MTTEQQEATLMTSFSEEVFYRNLDNLKSPNNF